MQLRRCACLHLHMIILSMFFHVTYIRIVFTILYFVIRTLNLCVWLPYDTVILKSKMLFFRRKNDAIFSGVGVKNCTPPLPKKSIFPLSAFLESRETKHLFLFLMIYFALQCIVWLYIQYSTVLSNWARSFFKLIL